MNTICITTYSPIYICQGAPKMFSIKLHNSWCKEILCIVVDIWHAAQPFFKIKRHIPSVSRNTPSRQHLFMSVQCINLFNSFSLLPAFDDVDFSFLIVQAIHFIEHSTCGCYFMNRFGIRMLHTWWCVLAFCMTAGVPVMSHRSMTGDATLRWAGWWPSDLPTLKCVMDWMFVFLQGHIMKS